MQKSSVWKKGIVVGIMLLCVQTSMALRTSDAGSRDQIDQQNSNTGGSSGSWFIYDTHQHAQEFKPSLDILTRVAIYGDREQNPPHGLLVSIRDTLTDTDLTSIEIPQDAIPENYPDWIMADFEDIQVTPGQSYYLICRTLAGAYPGELYAWGRTPDSFYPNGSAYHSMDNGSYWYTADDDFLFQTYGRSNTPPTMQQVQGPAWGITNVNYNFSVNVTDADGDDIYCKWDFGAGNITGWNGPYVSGETITVTGRWRQTGTYDIRVKLKDEHELESNWSDPHTITIYELQKTFMMGSYTNGSEDNGFIFINAKNLWTVHFKPFGVNHLTPGEPIIFSDIYKGVKTQRFLLGTFTIAVKQKSTLNFHATATRAVLP
jgi:hypothetical protein